MVPIIVFVTLGIGFVILIAFAIQAENKRKKAIEAAATELGLAFTPGLTSADQNLFQQFGLSQIGHSRAATLATVADSGELRLILFDYTYTTGSGKQKQTRQYHVVMATSQTLDLPKFSLSPESFFHRLGDFFGYKDIDFEDDETFSNQFLLKGDDESAIREFFKPARRTALVPLGQIYIETNRNSFIFYRSGKQRDLDHLRSMLEEGFTVHTKLSEAE
ncbi:MAG: hypothetical protein R3C53_06400 [Pirellulaceae bacterium]